MKSKQHLKVDLKHAEAAEKLAEQLRIVTLRFKDQGLTDQIEQLQTQILDLIQETAIELDA